jgi:hypothetical protein
VTKRWTRLDQVFISEEHLDAVITCEALSETPGINTDHLPILTTLDLNLTRALANSPRNFRNMDWETFNKNLATKLSELGPPSRIQSQVS